MARNTKPKTKFQADQDELKLRAAWLYYIEGLTQEQVAQNLDISRIKAFRLLAATREEGIVQISLNSHAEPLIRLQRALEKHLGLFEAIVVPSSDQSEASISSVIGHATGRYLSDRLQDGLTIGVGWGATLQACMSNLKWREISDLSVISLLGGLTHSMAYNPSAVAWRLAEFYKTELFQITAPVFVPHERLAQELWEIDDLKALRNKVSEIDLAILSVADVSKQASIFRRGLLTAEDAESLQAAGAVGDVLCQFVNEAGEIVDHPINKRAMAIDPTELRRVPKVIISAGGVRKAQAIRASILTTKAQVLITDEATAQELLTLKSLN
ncbi:sugar-binding transcriptional regulator [Pseudochrobactrum sp. sp1633]|uniref:sugar-binding transcriptional regulator n=1 Tax=Pseudochrobactrum sp. sp1633 TaxID=3036706 RepID=UPI0025A55BE5|nr:sugar-binding transcriptional regulator [Pseudochrobactrum sp. sp1633]MDM8346590.1 sugar-binding transcriptional regulator [Pseudochrobactrum sp. sp1633]HWD12636.1 sugar-binding transcriptional regulator [Pseudochrobactrum sp.]